MAATAQLNRLVAGRYKILGELGGGGTSLVYRARDVAGGPDVALKQLRPEFADNRAMRRRFVREAELTQRLDHPAIVRLLDVAEDEGLPLLVLELVGGRTLRQVLDLGQCLDRVAIRPIVMPLVRALDHAHAAGIVHRDLKPENVFIDGWKVKLADFGNARVVSLASVTGASLSWGTPEYVAPELFLRGRADPRSDFYALGVILYEMLTGRRPWSRTQTLTRLAETGRPPKLAPTGAGEGVDRLLSDLLAPSPADRPASGDEILFRLSDEGGAALPTTSTCTACGADRPDDVPRCFTCGHEVLQIARGEGQWCLVLKTLDDDAAAAERLLRTVAPLCKAATRSLQFLTGNIALYSEEEIKAGIDFPVVLLNDLAEKSARDLEALFTNQGFDVVAVGNARHKLLTANGKNDSGRIRVRLGALAALMGFSAFGVAESALAGLAGAVGGLTFGLIIAAIRPKRSRAGDQLFELRDQLAPVPAADRLLSDATVAAARIRAPEARALFAGVSTEIYRLTRRASELDRRTAKTGIASSEVDRLHRTLLAAPALLQRLERLAAGLDRLDAALEGTTEGELMASIARLERGAAAPGADRPALEATRRDLEATLERREATEQERARLSAKLCELLGRLRNVYQRALRLETEDDREAAALEAASAELDAFLATSS